MIDLIHTGSTRKYFFGKLCFYAIFFSGNKTLLFYKESKHFSNCLSLLEATAFHEITEILPALWSVKNLLIVYCTGKPTENWNTLCFVLSLCHNSDRPHFLPVYRRYIGRTREKYVNHSPDLVFFPNILRELLRLWTDRKFRLSLK